MIRFISIVLVATLLTAVPNNNFGISIVDAKFIGFNKQHGQNNQQTTIPSANIANGSNNNNNNNNNNPNAESFNDNSDGYKPFQGQQVVNTATDKNNNNSNVSNNSPLGAAKSPTTQPSMEPTSSPAPSPSPSEAPTHDPGPSHFPSSSPSDFPTSSPAPSPSPSNYPSSGPTRQPSGQPSSTPTVSAAPSTTPTATPSSIPSDMPSTTPSAQPTTSSEPSDMPSTLPSQFPSDLPSTTPSEQPTKSSMPSDIPSMTPSASPSILPSDQPSDMPSNVPSASPSSSPTVESMKTKTAITNVFLVGLPREMNELDMARFEIATLQFIKDTMPHPTLERDGYEIDVLAVTVLTQTIVFPDDMSDLTTTSTESTNNDVNNTTSDSNGAARRQLQGTTSSWDTALQVGFRTVGVVTSGRVPEENWDFTMITNHGFVENYNQYLWQLGSMPETDFFEPLKAYSNGGQVEMEEGTPNDNDDNEEGGKKSGKFVAALLLSFLAIGIAVFASYFAIRQHLQKKKRRRNRTSTGTKLSKGLGRDFVDVDPTRTLSDDPMDEESGSTGRRILAAFTTGSDQIIDIDDQSLESVGLTPRNQISPRMGFGDEGMPAESLNASPTNEEDRVDESFFGRGRSPGTFMKKWLTPRRSTGQYSSTTRYSTTSTTGRFDPPETDSIPGFNEGVPQTEPLAKKQTSQSVSGQLRSVSGNETVGASTTSNARNNEKEQFTVPVTMFSTGQDGHSEGVETPLASLVGSQASSYMGGLNIQKTFTGRSSTTGGLKEAPAFSEATGVFDKTNRSLVNQEQIVAATSKTGRRSDAMESKIQKFSSNTDTNRPNAVKSFQHNRQSKDLESKAAVEVTLGARSMSADSQDEHDLISPPKYRYNMSKGYSAKRPSSIGMTSNTSSNEGQQRTNKPVHVTATATSGPGYTLGARPMGGAGSTEEVRDEDDERSSLSSVVRRSGAYDVYAPSGPIGIVVDTSKDGPSVHSLKSTSPMMGLITPGDLIVALDDVDTRSMSAAALTRLMAKKSRQRERKITLYSMDGY